MDFKSHPRMLVWDNSVLISWKWTLEAEHAYGFSWSGECPLWTVSSQGWPGKVQGSGADSPQTSGRISHESVGKALRGLVESLEMRGGTHRCGQQNGLIEVNVMVDSWDRMIFCQYKRYAQLETDGISGWRIGNLQTSLTDALPYGEYFGKKLLKKRTLLYLFGKKESERLGIRNHSRITLIHSLSLPR